MNQQYNVRVTNVTNNVWIHSVVNFIGPGEGQGIRIYHDGNSVNQYRWTITVIKNSVDTKNININIGKIPIPFWPVVSVEVDELYFFNQALTTAEIKILSNDESYP